MLHLFQANKKIVVNTDIDGILCGLLLHELFGCEIVGFSNSDNTVWIDESKIKSIYEAIYIDMFVPRSDVVCIDQHIVSVNMDHHDLLQRNPNKINPNLDNPRFHQPSESYYIKYPFGTFHYLISTLEGQGVKINIEQRNVRDDLSLFDLMLRADDTMITTLNSRYQENAREWWKWLRKRSNRGQMTEQFIQYLGTVDRNSCSEIKQKTGLLLTSDPFYCASPDGGYKNILDENGSVKFNIKAYVDFLSDSLGFSRINFASSYTPIIGKTNRIRLEDDLIQELVDSNTIHGEEVFSYAFVRSAERDSNFSYTVMKEKTSTF